MLKSIIKNNMSKIVMRIVFEKISGEITKTDVDNVDRIIDEAFMSHEKYVINGVEADIVERIDTFEV